MGKDRKRLFPTMVYTRGADGKYELAVSDIIGATGFWIESDIEAGTEGAEVVGDADAFGTAICTLSISAGKYFICTNLMGSTNVGAMVYIAQGSIVTGVSGITAGEELYIIDLQNVGSNIIITETMPIFVYDNTASAAAVTLTMYAPETAKGVATNNDANHYFDGYIGGLEY